ncbi:hypothetical protein SCUCBS95973_000917 [Sporothrix curviconia]|uniref:Polymerase nucleotidyl transferase domain-containing protein n=1 Tax=Sporothrix curviconia TaxID=1260050 RepID=A0ABP0AUA8_9PEZI
MGGSAFASGADAVYTPRMPPAVYTAVRDSCHAILFSLFAVVATPIEGPGKADFGDVDILLALPLESKGESQRDAAALLREAVARLGAVRSSVVAREGKVSIAVPWPADLLSLVPTSSSPSPSPSSPSSSSTPAHIQVDLAIAPSLGLLHWALFKHAHGDLWNILGAAVLRPLGLTIDERALWLRVPEIEQAHRNRAKVFLSDEPATVLHFLGLSVLDKNRQSQWEAPFASATDLFEYATTSRFFVLPDDTDGTDGTGDTGNTGDHAGGTDGRKRYSYSQDLSVLKANDRRRMLYRPLFRQWITEYVPALQTAAHASGSSRGQETAAAVAVTRESVREAAFAYFPGTEVQYHAVRTAWLRERHLMAIRAAAKEAVPLELPSQYRGVVCAAVRQRLGLVMDRNDGADGGGSAAVTSAALWTVEGVSAFVATNWSAISAAYSPAEHAQYLRDAASQKEAGSP